MLQSTQHSVIAATSFQRRSTPRRIASRSIDGACAPPIASKSSIGTAESLFCMTLVKSATYSCRVDPTANWVRIRLLRRFVQIQHRTHEILAPGLANRASSRRRDCGAVKLGSHFHTHDFEQHANAPTVVQMRKTAKGLREWSRHDPHFLADLETVIEANRPAGPHMRRPTLRPRPPAPASAAPHP